mmetsp:Transcript_9345/g.25267  ORF Transcript_9345/g.25267 Transcript_9345/m.25267 type:complete len:654 (+) Transcript_9345:467-2428(+)
MGQRGAPTAGELVQAPPGHRDGLGRRQEHLGLVTVEWDERNKVSGRVRLGEQAHDCPLGGGHPVQRHASRGVDHEHHQRACLPGQALAAHIALLDVHGLLGESLLRLSAPAGPLVGGRRPKGGVHREAPDLALGQHGLDISAPLFAEYQRFCLSSAPLGPLLLLGEHENGGIQDDALCLEHELLRNLVWLVFGLLVVLVLFVLLLFVLLLFFLVLLLLILRRGRGRRRGRLLVLVLRWRLIQQDRPGQDDKLHGLLQVLGLHLIPSLERRGRFGDAYGKDFRPVAHDAASPGLLHQVLDLLIGDDHLLKVLTGEDDAGSQGVSGLFRLLQHLSREILEPGRGLDGANPRVERVGHVRREGHGNTVKKMLPQRPLLRVVRRQKQRATRVRDGDTLALHDVHPVRKDGEQQVGNAVVQKVDLVNVQDASVGLGQEPRLENRLPFLHGGFNIDRPHETILRHAQRNLDERRVPDLDRHLVHGGELLGQAILPLVRIRRIRIANAPLNDLDGGEQGVHPSGHDRLGGSPPSRDGDPAELVINGPQQQRLLDVIHSDDLRERIRTLHTHALRAHVGGLAFGVVQKLLDLEGPVSGGLWLRGSRNGGSPQRSSRILDALPGGDGPPAGKRARLPRQGKRRRHDRLPRRLHRSHVGRANL